MQVEAETQLQLKTIYTFVTCLGRISIDKKLLSHLVDYGCVCGAIRVNPVTKENVWQKYFFRYVKV